MTNTDWRFVKYLDSIEHEYGYMLEHTGFYVCPGWMILIQDMLRELDATATTDDHPALTTIKEKFGTLRVYGYNIDDTQQEIIDRYAGLSAETCMTCGAFGRMHVKNKWFYVACAEHANGGLAEDED